MKKILRLLLTIFILSEASLQISACDKVEDLLDIRFDNDQEKEAIKNIILDFLYSLPIDDQPSVDRNDQNITWWWEWVYLNNFKVLWSKITIKLPTAPTTYDYWDVKIQKTKIKGYFVIYWNKHNHYPWNY